MHRCNDSGLTISALIARSHIDDATYSVELELTAILQRHCSIDLLPQRLISAEESCVDVCFVPKLLLESYTVSVGTLNTPFNRHTFRGIVRSGIRRRHRLAW